MAEKIKWVKGIKTIIKMGMKPKSTVNNKQSDNLQDSDEEYNIILPDSDDEDDEVVFTVNNTFEKEGLLFESLNDYYTLKNLNINAYIHVEAIKDGSLDIREFFSRYDKVKVKELYKNASYNLDNIFGNVERLYMEADEDDDVKFHYAVLFNKLLDIEYY